MKDIPIPPKEASLVSLFAIFRCAYSPNASVRKVNLENSNLDVTVALLLRKNHAEESDARVYEIGMQTRPGREKEKRIAFLFLPQNRYYSARINEKKGAVPHSSYTLFYAPPSLLIEDERTDVSGQNKYCTTEFLKGFHTIPPLTCDRQQMLNLITIHGCD